MIAYNYDNDGKYDGTCNCQLDPIATNRVGYGVYLIPANATLVPPPQFDPETEVPVWGGKQWAIETLPKPDPEPEPTPEPEPAPEYVTYSELAAAIREGVNAV